MNRDIQSAILRACGRYMRKALEPIEQKLASLEQRAMQPGPRGEDGRDGKNGVDGRDGKDAEPVALGDVAAALIGADELRTLVDLHVAEAVTNHMEANPPPAGQRGEPGRDGQDGISVSVDDVERMLESRMAGWALDFERRAQGVLERAVERMPKPADGKDGRDGSDGRDGMGFDDLRIEHDGERTVTLVFERGDDRREHALALPVTIDRGVYKADGAYQRGDGVTFGGSWWIAQKDAPSDKPGHGDGWRLAVKKGRDGKDGKDGDRGPEGKAAPALPRHGGPY